MKSLKRFNFKNYDYFITAVTYNREPLLLKDIDLFWASLHDIELKAWVIMPDHLHMIFNLGDRDLSKLMHKFKITYSRRFRDKYRPGRVWQNRFWDRLIRDEEELENYVNYIHYNPVKEGLVKEPFLYKHSSIHLYYNEGKILANWGKDKKPDFEGNFGE